MNHRRKQDLCLDAIEASFHMIKTAYFRLKNYCLNYAELNQSELDNAFILDAWSLIDVAKRLRTMISQTPGLSVTGPLLDFIHEYESVVDFRDYIQHLEEKTKYVAPSGRPIWGSFSWVRLLEGEQFHIVGYVPGRLAKTEGVPVVNPAGRIFHDEIDHIEITIQDKTLNLSELKRNIELLEQKFTDAYSRAQPKTLENGEEILRINFE